MTTPIEQQIVIAVSSRALFNLESEHHIFEEQGVEAYRAWQVAHANEPLEPGTSFPFIQKLLRINTLFGDKQPFRVVVLSRNTPETGQRFFNSCRAYNLPITAGAFTSGQSTFPYLQAFDASLFLSANKENVFNAVSKGQPAGLVIPGSTALNRTCLWSKEDIEPGEFYHYDMKMVPTDHTLKRGHKLALILYGIDAQQTQRPDTVTEITFIADSIDVRVPVIR